MIMNNTIFQEKSDRIDISVEMVPTISMNPVGMTPKYIFIKKCHRYAPNIKRALFIFILLMGIFNSAFSQSEYLIGYEKSLAGKDFIYHSLHNDVEKSLLSRANSYFEPIEWETQAVPQDYEKESVSFIWLYGIDVRPKTQEFDLFVNDDLTLRFSNPTANTDDPYHIKGENGIVLSFKPSMVDKHGDEMGYAVLTIPTKLIKRGKPVTVKVDGVDNDSQAWYMTYKVPLESAIEAKQLKTVTKQNGALFHTIRFNYIHLGEPEEATISVDGEVKEVMLRTGLNEIDYLVAKTEEPVTVATTFTVGEVKQELEVQLKPVKEWTVYLVQHSHTDIGYTRAQSEILAEHLRYIDYALDYCDQTDSYPEDAQFRWTCEASWAVREYLNNRPKEQTDRLIQRIKEGRIEVTGMFFNFSEVVDETALAIQLQALRQFKEKGIDVKTAMQNDVNGIGWCMVDYYHNTGVKYVTMGQHGHRARIPFNKPTAFWWESPSGNKLLAYRSEHYMHGNALSLTSGKIDVFRDNLSNYLTDLEAKAYPLNRTSFQFSGYITDNSPPSTKACDIVEEWNSKYEWPKLKLALASEFMVYIDKNHPEILETKREAWPDWWTDGFGTAMNETKTSRETAAEMIATTGLLSMAQVAGATIPQSIHDDITLCYDNLLFYTEHTFGADESISNPKSINSKNQWSQKSSYVWTAYQQANLLREKAIGLIQPYIELPEKASVTVFNTLNRTRSGLVEAFIYHDILPLDREFRITDEKENTVPAQIIKSRNEGSYWALWVEDIPAMGYTNLEISVFDEPLKSSSTQRQIAETVENDFYKIVIDEDKNGITSIYDKALKKELIDPECSYALGTFIYEEVEHRGELERLTHNVRDTAYRPIKRALTQVTDFHISDIEDGKIWTSIKCNGKIDKCADARGVDMEIRLYKYSKQIELLYAMTKNSNTDPNSIYVAFPFTSEDNGHLVFEAQGGIIQPGVNQLEGTASDWNTIQNFAAVKRNNSQIIFSSNDIPLVQFGDINTGHFYYKHKPKTCHIYSWVLNNYWTTNFKADQSGELEWKYQFTSTVDNSNSTATRFGVSRKVPLISRTNAAPEGDQSSHSKKQISESFLDLNSVDNLLLVSARPTEDGIILHLRETEGNHAIVDITKLLQQENIKAVYEVNALGEKLKELTGPLLVEHWEVKFLLLEM